MKYLKQISLILVIWVMGEYLSQWLSPYVFIPGNIMGMLLLLISLLTGVVKENHILEVGQFLLDHMAFFFIPLAVNLLGQSINIEWGLLLLITFIVTPIVMILTTFVTDKLMNLKERD
ncbi:MAG: CidA/LrgA family protein [Turicibacter sp.]